MGQLSNCRNLPPALMEASGLRRSWPSNGDELLPQLGGALLLVEPEFADLKLLRDSRWKAISSAKSLNIPIVSGVFTLTGFGSIAQSVPKNVPSRSVIGTEI